LSPWLAGGTAVKGVIDLRAYAAAAAPGGSWLEGRAAPAFADSAATVVAAAPTGSGHVESLPNDEFVVVLSGELVFRGGLASAAVPSGQSAVLKAGTSFDWRASPGTLAIIVACPTSAVAAACGIVSIDQQAPLAPSNPPLAALLVGPTPQCRNHTDFQSGNGEFVCGTWDSTPYHRSPMPYRHIELMHLLDGSVSFRDAGGSVSFGRGDVLLCARGAECAWISDVPVKKVYAIHRPA
jgi:uncharacterized cupin superfamily protein